jgi:hypothetical protein
MRLPIPTQTIVLPVALAISGLAYMWLSNFHTFKQVSPIYPAKVQIERWAAGVEKANSCIPSSINLDIERANGFVTTGKGPWFGTIRCNQPHVYVRDAAVWIVPWLMMNAVLMLLATSNATRVRKR